MEINGIKVEDATRPIRLHISERDTKLGDTKDPGACAAARACMREVPECSAARIHLSRSYLRIGGRWLRFETPQALRSEIVAFDRGGTFEAGEYTLRAIPATLRTSARAQHHKKTYKAKSGSNTNRNSSKLRKKTRKLAVRHVTTNVRAHGANR